MKNIFNNRVLIIGGDSNIGKSFYSKYKDKFKVIHSTSRKKKILVNHFTVNIKINLKSFIQHQEKKKIFFRLKITTNK